MTEAVPLGPGRLLGIAMRAEKGAPMQAIAAGHLVAGAGLAEDGRRSRNRPLTILAEEDWLAACAAAGCAGLPWTARRANLLVGGIVIARSLGRRLRIGPALVAVIDETEPCRTMDRAAPGLMAALTPAWRGGIVCRVLEGAPIAPGDPVSLE